MYCIINNENSSSSHKKKLCDGLTIEFEYIDCMKILHV